MEGSLAMTVGREGQSALAGQPGVQFRAKTWLGNAGVFRKGGVVSVKSM